MKLAGISLGSNSYCNATCTAYLAKVTEPRVATLGLTPAIPAIRKYVLVKSKRPEKVKAFMLFAALISANSFTQVSKNCKTGSRTRFPSDNLTDVPIFSAVHIRKERRKARHGDVSREYIELWDAVPNCAFGGKHVNQEDFGLDELAGQPRLEDRQRLRNCQSKTCERSQKLTGAEDGTHIERKAGMKSTEMY